MSDRRKTKTTPALERRKRNRRAFVRWPLEFDVRLTWGTQSVYCRGYAIAEGGLSLVCEVPLPRETEIEIEYRLPQAAPVIVKGMVRYVEGAHFGLEFLNLGLKDRLALVEHCEKLNPV
ncbi:MAG: hypothetical protein DMG61_06160 [Acidobacteria bacterium]|nr:MAG: hypothetical protein DMG60_20040 [Acidobacteriota bacterium]PYY15793.1 MAG: hypothetical protein DMG61_06160 [Acidobacteriota bacterium]